MAAYVPGAPDRVKATSSPVSLALGRWPGSASRGQRISPHCVEFTLPLPQGRVWVLYVEVL
jgi:hypothetical protein